MDAQTQELLKQKIYDELMEWDIADAIKLLGIVNASYNVLSGWVK